MLTHIKSLEDIVIALSDTEDDKVEYKKAQKVAKKIKRKRQERRRNNNDDSDTSEDSSIIRRLPHSRSANRDSNNKPRIFQYENKKEKETEETKQEMDIVEDNQDE